MKRLAILGSLLLFTPLGAADVPHAVNTVAHYLVRIDTIGGHERIGRELANEGTSTGILLGEEGYILTGAFNFLHDPASILLTFPDGSRKTATKIATDRLRMLSLLKVHNFEGAVLPMLPYRNKESIRIGERCIAVGNVFPNAKSAGPNVALGIISGKDRIWGKAIQTDAAIGPNNYGGLLVDRHGNAFGIPVPLSMMSQDVAAGAEMYDAGVGLAIPWQDAMEIVTKLKKGQDLMPGSFGFGFKENQTFIGEPVIAMVQPNSPADEAGLRPGDQIMKIDNVPMPKALLVMINIRQRYAGDVLMMSVLRDGAERTVTLTADSAGLR